MVKQQIDNAAHLIAAEGREDHGVVDTVEEFGLEGAAQNGLHVLAGFLAKGAVFADAVQNLAAAQVAGHDQDGVFEVHRPSLAVGHATVVENLQQHVEDIRVCLFDLIKQHNGIRLAAHSLG